MSNEISLTPPSKIVDMTKAFPADNDGARPVVYEQVIEAPGRVIATGKPDPAQDN